MSKFHCTVNRRDFMKALGLGVAGIGAVSATTPVFRDLDEVASSPKAVLHRGWYVKERDYGDPTIEIDWSLMKRRDLRGYSNWDFPTLMFTYPGGPEAFQKHLHDQGTAVTAKAKEIWPEYTGPSTRTYALSNAFAASAYSNSGYVLNANQFGMKTIAPAPRPQDIGMPVWQGTPEENTAMIRAVFSLVGLGPMIGTTMLDEKSENFVWEYNGKGVTGGDAKYGNKHIIFDPNISEAYSDDTTFRIPTSHKYVIATHNLSCDEFLRTGLSGSGAYGTEEMSYVRVAYAKSVVEQFIRGLGYNVAYGHDLQAATAWDIWSGVGEHCRMGQITGSPELGGLLRTHAVFYTDLPLELTKPIDAGFAKFCETCGTCADTCPVGAISPRGVDRNWDSNTGQDWVNDKQAGGTQVMYNMPGFKGWRCNSFACAFSPCGSACKGACPFNTIADGSFIHSIVKSTVATTPVFNSFFTSMEGILHYGKQDKDPEKWWNNPDAWHIYGTNPNNLRQ
ncbi:reductive dehalogenase [Dehalococcoides mccartyi]|uniref:Reductive dehalogenase n=3 Tax=Bacteria TaxID=2 RepID=A0A142VBN9_9CHLR|nr:reductive dehalogenase [Dehalococcoides mccartyi]AMU87250.1 reductive dehalogenase [Dehalococcoides mccartyi]QBX64465.1 reductive dehalogenase [Dehalococcoides mccartyi]